MILNLGCGPQIIKGAVNVDVRPLPDVQQVDLNLLPWPFDDEQFDKVLAYAILEHLKLDLVEAMDEIWRVCKPGALLRVKVPWWKAQQAHNGLHRWQYNVYSFNLFDPMTHNGQVYGYYTDKKWRVEKAYLVANCSLHFEMRKV